MEPIWAGLKLGGATGAALLAAAKLDDGSVSVTAAVSIAVFVSGAIWWLGRKFQSIDDKMERMSDAIEKLPCTNCPHNKK